MCNLFISPIGPPGSTNPHPPSNRAEVGDDVKMRRIVLNKIHKSGIWNVYNWSFIGNKHVLGL